MSSAVPVRIVLPSGLKATAQTRPGCGKGAPRGLPLAASQSRASPLLGWKLPLPVRMVLPSGLKARSLIGSCVWQCLFRGICRSRRPRAGTIPSEPPVTNRFAVRTHCRRFATSVGVNTVRRTGTSRAKGGQAHPDGILQCHRVGGRGLKAPSHPEHSRIELPLADQGLALFDGQHRALLLGFIESSGKIGRQFLRFLEQPLGAVLLDLGLPCSSINAALERAWHGGIPGPEPGQTGRQRRSRQPGQPPRCRRCRQRWVALAPAPGPLRRAHAPRRDRFILDEPLQVLGEAPRPTRSDLSGPCRSPCARSSRGPAALAG